MPVIISFRLAFRYFELQIYFRGRNFRELTKTFANINFWDEFRVKNFRKNQKTLHLQGKKLLRIATIFFFFSFFCQAEVYKY